MGEIAKGKTEKASVEPIPQESVKIKNTKPDISTTRLEIAKGKTEKASVEQIPQGGSVADKHEAFIHETISKTQVTKGKTEKASVEPIPQESVKIKNTKPDLSTTRLEITKGKTEKASVEQIPQGGSVAD